MITTTLLTGKTDSHIHWLDNKQGIHLDAVSAWHDLVNGAKSSGFELEIASGYRDFSRQLSIWNRKYNGQLAVKDSKNIPLDKSQHTESEWINAILLFSALPGASRHHWGTDIDIYAKNLLPANASLQLEPWEYQCGGYFHSLTQWLNNEAQHYGFFFPYDTYRGGVACEPWHLSYRPLAEKLQKNYSLDVIYKTISASDIAGKDHILANIEEIYQKYITNIGT